MTIQIANAQTPAVKTTLPQNTIDCAGFHKMPNGDWFALPNNPPFDVGHITQTTMTNINVPPHGYKLDGANLYDVIEAKCGASAK